MDAAFDVFLSEGFVGASMERVAMRAGVSKMTVYRHYESKEELFLATMNRTSQHLFDTEKQVPASSAEDARSALLAFGQSFMETITTPEVLELAQMLVGEFRRFPQLAAQFYDVVPARTIAVISRILSGIMPEDEVKAKAPALMHMFMGDIYQQVSFRKMSREQAIAEAGPQIQLAVDLILGSHAPAAAGRRGG